MHHLFRQTRPTFSLSALKWRMGLSVSIEHSATVFPLMRHGKRTNGSLMFGVPLVGDL